MACNFIITPLCPGGIRILDTLILVQIKFLKSPEGSLREFTLIFCEIKKLSRKHGPITEPPWICFARLPIFSLQKSFGLMFEPLLLGHQKNGKSDPDQTESFYTRAKCRNVDTGCKFWQKKFREMTFLCFWNFFGSPPPSSQFLYPYGCRDRAHNFWHNSDVYFANSLILQNPDTVNFFPEASLF
jgi:hypothetical protein